MLHIGISGPIASGKSTLAKTLKEIMENHGFSVHLISFAGSVKQLAAIENHPARVIIMTAKLAQWGYDSTKAHLAAIMIDEFMNMYPSTTGIKNRRLLQYIGTEVGRQFINEDIWIYRVKQLAKEHPITDFIISDDLRFDNEAYAVDVHVRITIPDDRKECYNKQRGDYTLEYLYNNHVSEQSLTVSALLEIPVCFSRMAVTNLFHSLNTIRRLRY